MGSSEIDTKYPIGIEFQLDDINDPVFGSATNLKGWLPFVLPPGIYKYPSILNEPKRFENVVNELIPTCRDLFPDLLDEDIFNLISDRVAITALLNCSEMENDVEKALALITVIAFKYDDIFDNLVNSDYSSCEANMYIFKYKQMSQTLQEAENKLELADGQAKYIDSILNELPSFDSMVCSFKKCFAKMFEYAGETSLVNLDTMKENNTGLKANIAVPELKNEGHIFSATTQFEMYRQITGLRPTLQIYAEAQNIRLNPAIKSDILFQTMFNNYADITVFLNAIFGLKRDIKNGGEDGPIMYLVTVKKWPLQKAYDEIYSRVLDAINDYIINSKKLMEIYGEEDENLIKYVNIMGKVIDGWCYAYKTVKRYGVQENIKLVYQIPQE